jgi:hypothetical protein
MTTTERFSIHALRPIAGANGEAVIDVTTRAVDSLLAVHASTGIDLTVWEEVLQLVTIVYPYIVIEGTGPTDTNTVTSPEGYGETGRYWLDGDTSKPFTHDCYGLNPWSQPALGRTR